MTQPTTIVINNADLTVETSEVNGMTLAEVDYSGVHFQSLKARLEIAVEDLQKIVERYNRNAGKRAKEMEKLQEWNARSRETSFKSVV